MAAVPAIAHRWVATYRARMRASTLFAILLLFAACEGSPEATNNGGPTTFAPPSVRRENVVDDYHGTQVQDPYRWLEDQDGEEVQEFAAAQNRASRAFLDAIPERAAVRARLAELWNYARYEPPIRRGERWFWWKNDGLQNQAVLYTSADPKLEGEVLLDPNTLSADGTLAISGLAIAHDGSKIAYGTSQSGSDWRTFHVLDVASKQKLPDEVQWSKFSGASWTRDSAGFFYQRYAEPKAGETFQAPNKQPQLCYHKVGTEQHEDRVIYERPDQPDFGFGPRVTDDGRFLLIGISEGTSRKNRVAYVDLDQDPMTVQALWMEPEANWNFLGNDGDTFFFRTDKDAPRGRIVALNRNTPQDSLSELVPQSSATLQDAVFCGRQFVCHYLDNASSAVRLFTATGEARGAIELPGVGTVASLTGAASDTDAYFTFTTFIAPPTIYRLAVADKTLAPCRIPAFRGRSDDLVTQRVFLQSKDGTRLCMFLTHQRGLRLDGSAPCYLYGYGGFGISVTPSFRVGNFVFCERGGIYAQAVLRGGGEFGEDWHQQGMLSKKQNVFDDFTACAEFLVRNRYTEKSHLAIGGGSNGGLLVGACLVQRPELFAAAIPEVGVLDMLRYHQFTIGWAWASEYGRSDDKDQFAWLYNYSPLHNIEPGVSYPAVMVMTGDHDDRVLPGHSYKFAAALQAAQAGSSPVLLRVETSAGHGAGTPVGKLIDEAADRLSFLQATVGGGSPQK